MPDALFDIATPTAPVRKSGDARRRARQDQAIERGHHPLGVALRINTDAPATRDRNAPGVRCGGCRFRDLHNGGTASTFAKCWWRPGDSGPYPRITRGPGTDVRAWWPACRDWQPREQP